MKKLLLSVLSLVSILSYSQGYILKDIVSMDTSGALNHVFEMNTLLEGEVVVTYDVDKGSGWARIDEFGFFREDIQYFSDITNVGCEKIIKIEETDGHWAYILTVEYDGQISGVGEVYISKSGRIVVYELPQYLHFKISVIRYDENLIADSTPLWLPLLQDQ